LKEVGDPFGEPVDANEKYGLSKTRTSWSSPATRPSLHPTMGVTRLRQRSCRVDKPNGAGVNGPGGARLINATKNSATIASQKDSQKPSMYASDQASDNGQAAALGQRLV
jgi:hypothetical protein